MTVRRKAAPTTKRTRTPVSGNRDILNVKGTDDGFVYRWVNDTDDRIQMFEKGGYEKVDHEVEIGSVAVNRATTVGKTVTKNVGKGTEAHLMRIKREWYDEDQANKQTQVDDTEAAMKQQLNSGSDGQYGKVKFK